MQADVGIGVDPVSAGGVAAIDDRDGRVGMREQRVGERHSRGARTDNEIVRFEFLVHHSATIVVAADLSDITPRNCTRSYGNGYSNRLPSGGIGDRALRQKGTLAIVGVIAP